MGLKGYWNCGFRTITRAFGVAGFFG